MKILFLCFTFFSLAACANQPVDTKKSDLEKAARLMSSERGLSVWKIMASDELHKNREGNSFKEVVIYSDPRSIEGKLCKAKVYIFQAFDFTSDVKWELVDLDGSGYTTLGASVVENSCSQLCSQLPLDSYFDAHDPIEDNTLIALYSSLAQQLKSGLAKNIDPDDFKIRSINVSPRAGFIGSYRYSASVETGVRKRLLTVEIALDSAKFNLRN
ncbi:hypothetical protein N2488_06755 [SAR92 clade bacterium H231]|nr:hypothetical protein [SAR92 clade bacterium H231]